MSFGHRLAGQVHHKKGRDGDGDGHGEEGRPVQPPVFSQDMRKASLTMAQSIATTIRSLDQHKKQKLIWRILPKCCRHCWYAWFLNLPPLVKTGFFGFLWLLTGTTFYCTYHKSCYHIPDFRYSDGSEMSHSQRLKCTTHVCNPMPLGDSEARTNAECLEQAQGSCEFDEGCHWVNWPIYQGVYYTIQAGLSVGFGAVNEAALVHDSSHHIFTIFIVVGGSTIIMAIFAIFIEVIVQKFIDIDAWVQKEFSGIDKDGDGQVTLEELMNYVKADGAPPKYARYNSEKGMKLLEEMFKEMDEDGSGDVNIDEFVDYMQSRVPMCKRIIYKLDDWKVGLILFTWLLFGALYMSMVNEWPFTAGLYWAVAACSTGGLMAPYLDAANLWFCSFYLIVGIPSYALVLGAIASWVSDRLMRKRARLKYTESCQDSLAAYDRELKFLDDGRIDKYEYLCLELLKTGKAKSKWIRKVDEEFKNLDLDKSGYIEVTQDGMNDAFAAGDDPGPPTYTTLTGSGAQTEDDNDNKTKNNPLTPKPPGIRDAAPGSQSTTPVNIEGREGEITPNQLLDLNGGRSSPPELFPRIPGTPTMTPEPSRDAVRMVHEDKPTKLDSWEVILPPDTTHLH